MSSSVFYLLIFLMPALAGYGYFRLVSLGMERHLSRLGWGMYFLAISKVIGMREMFGGWLDSRLVNLVNDYQLFWILEKVFLFLGILLIGSWVFSYLLKRFETQLSLFLGVIVVLVFGASVVFYSFVITYTYQKSMLSQAGEVLKLTQSLINNKGKELLAQTKVLAGSKKQLDLVTGKGGELAKIEIEEVAKSAGVSRIWVVDDNLRSLLLWGGESDSLNKEVGLVAKTQKESSGYGLVEIDKEIYIMSGSAIKGEDKVVGYVFLAKKIDSGYLSGLNLSNWNLLVWVAGELRGQSGYSGGMIRLGIKDVAREYEIVRRERVEIKNLSWKIAGKDYLGVSGPLFDSRESTIGVLSVVVPVYGVWFEILTKLSESYQWAMLLLVTMIIPAYLMARKLRSQID